MPIRPENRDRYPPDWPEISARVRMEANGQCEWCGALNGATIRRGKAADGTPVYRYASWSAYMDGLSADTGTLVPESCEDLSDYGDPVRVILTVAHLDHRPENCERANLVALCQRCHNRYDAPERRKGIAERKRAANAVSDFFD